ncbi:putative ribonuclease H-like domain-containing protein [Tanacetum coccineum]
MESDEVIKSSVEDLAHTSSESDGIFEDECDLSICDDSSPKKDEVLDDIISIPPGNGNDHFNAESSLIESVLNSDFDPKGDIRFIKNLMYDNSFPRPPKTLKDDSETLIDSNNDYSSSHDDSPYSEDIDYVDALPPDPELVSLEIMNHSFVIVNPISGDFTNGFGGGIFDNPTIETKSLFEVTNCATPKKNVKKATNASLILEDSYPPLSLYELPFHKEVPGLGILLSFSSENEEKVFNPGILTSKRVHTYLLPKLSHRGPKAFKVIKILESPMEIFLCSYGENIPHLDGKSRVKIYDLGLQDEWMDRMALWLLPHTRNTSPELISKEAQEDQGNPQMDLQDQGVIDSGCSRHMTGNMSYLTDYEEIDGGYVAFGGNPKGGKITGKGTIKTGNLDFENVYFVRELKFNLFSVSQMCDKKNSVLFNDTECIVLSPNFKLIDESQVLLRVPRKNNMYSVDLKNIVPKRGLTCLFAKATSDESKLWHRRLGHLNFKTMNKLVKGNLVRGLPSKLFENDQTCVACQKGKQHRASCKSKTENSISLPLHLLHMDLFGPTFVKSLMKKMYCLVVTDDYSRFTWVFFLATKDETSGILKSFITGIENLVDHKVKVIRCDNGTEFKNREMNQFCEMKGILRQFSIARTPQ